VFSEAKKVCYYSERKKDKKIILNVLFLTKIKGAKFDYGGYNY